MEAKSIRRIAIWLGFVFLSIVLAMGLTLSIAPTAWADVSDAESSTRSLESRGTGLYSVVAKSHNEYFGSVFASASSAYKGDEVKLTVKPKGGYRFVGWQTEPSDLSIDENGVFVMPGGNVEVTAVFEAIQTYDIDVSVNDGRFGAAEADCDYAEAGVPVFLTAVPNEGYRFVGWDVNPDSVKVKDGMFTMPAENVSVTAIFESISASPDVDPYYEVSIVPTENGSVNIDSMAAKEGETVTIAATPELGYEVGTVSVVAGGKAVDVAKNSDGTFSFKMPNGDVEVSATFVDTWNNPFTDLTAAHWGYGAVRQANLMGLMQGIGGTTLFDPDGGLERSQAATVMWNLMGEGDLGAPAAQHADVDQSQWYAPYVNWAVAEGVMDGYEEGYFGVSDVLTREQFAAVVAKAAKADLSQADVSSLGPFKDADDVDSWAVEAMAWAVDNGVVSGVRMADGSRELQATRTVTRAEMATMVINAIDAGVLVHE